MQFLYIKDTAFQNEHMHFVTFLLFFETQHSKWNVVFKEQQKCDKMECCVLRNNKIVTKLNVMFQETARLTKWNVMFQETTKLWLNGMLCFKKQEECDKMESFVFQGAARVWQNRKLYFKEQ